MSQDTSPLSPFAADPVLAHMRPVHRAIAELRRGAPILLEGEATLVLWAAETVGAQGLAEAAPLCAGPPVLLLAPTRGAALLRRPVQEQVVALRTAGLLDPAMLRGMADPIAPQLLAEPPEPAALPPDADAALALAKLARLLPAVLAAPARTGAAARAGSLDLLTVRARDVLAYPNAAAAALVRVAEAVVPLEAARGARIVAFRAPDSAIEHLAIVVGAPDLVPVGAPAPLVRLHSECFTGDLLGSLRCDCGPQLHAALARIGQEGAGALLYLAQEGRGIGLVNKLRAYTLQDRGLDTVDANRALGWHADERNFMVAATMLGQLGIARVRLLTNNPDKVAALSACGIEVAAREPLVIPPNGVDDRYLATKADRLGHLL